jgi:cleavage and polyadenylation specificity factor subunit 1
MGAVLQQRVDNAWQPLAFFSKKLNPAQHKYSAYDRELLAVYEVVKHFHHMLEARHFIIFTDHKPITYTFQQKRDKRKRRDAVAILVVKEAEERADGTGQRRPMCWRS